jgi:hypothetical protein
VLYNFGSNVIPEPRCCHSLTHSHTHTPLDEILTTKNRPMYLKMSGEERVCVVLCRCSVAVLLQLAMFLCTRNSLSLSCIAFFITLASVVIL